ncbi:hypothetical protein Isop_1726 [Isosphaera pallida ATCC 43644]|uniref:30S ribosomal protein THX n=1 Tax=Isosphaera pallida (strain ATCC 43644 / DSM 9630 / IS1B) TaxID=575540 RepID=E8R0W4_ISOPI|nr:hypothetical protein Isop_1726 [Isosphaera pallida ATCC 43644]
MGKGDRRTFRGKLSRGSFGKCRPRKPSKKASKPVETAGETAPSTETASDQVT